MSEPADFRSRSDGQARQWDASDREATLSVVSAGDGGHGGQTETLSADNRTETGYIDGIVMVKECILLDVIG